MLNDSIGFDELYRLPNPLEFDCERVQQPLSYREKVGEPHRRHFLGILGYTGVQQPLFAFEWPIVVRE